MSKILPTDHPLVRCVTRSLSVILNAHDERVIAELVSATLPKHYLQAPPPAQDGGSDSHGTLADVGAVVGGADGKSDRFSPTTKNFVPSQACVNAIEAITGVHGESSGGVTDSASPDWASMYAIEHKHYMDAADEIVRLNRMLVTAKRNEDLLRGELKEQVQVANTLREHRDALVMSNKDIGEANHALRKAIHLACNTLAESLNA